MHFDTPSFSFITIPSVLPYKNSEKRRSWKVLQTIFNIKKYKISFRDTTNIYYRCYFLILVDNYIKNSTSLIIPQNDGLRDPYISILRSHINILFSLPKIFPKTESKLWK